MKHSFIILILALISYINIISRVDANLSIFCKPCGKHCDRCRYGTYINYCLQTECARGPNQTCGEELGYLLGKCGEGLVCNACNVCVGCYIGENFECTDNSLVTDCHKPKPKEYIIQQ